MSYHVIRYYVPRSVDLKLFIDNSRDLEVRLGDNSGHIQSGFFLGGGVKIAEFCVFF